MPKVMEDKDYGAFPIVSAEEFTAEYPQVKEFDWKHSKEEKEE